MATPIGTLADLPPRARDVLAEVDLVLAEDTRRARALFSHFGLPSKGRLMSLHEHNELRQVPKVVEALREYHAATGQRVILAWVMLLGALVVLISAPGTASAQTADSNANTSTKIDEEPIFASM